MPDQTHLFLRLLVLLALEESALLGFSCNPWLRPVRGKQRCHSYLNHSTRIQRYKIVNFLITRSLIKLRLAITYMVCVPFVFLFCFIQILLDSKKVPRSRVIIYEACFSLSSEPVVYSNKGPDLAFYWAACGSIKHGWCICRKKTKWPTDLLEGVTCPSTPPVGRPWQEGVPAFWPRIFH